MILGGGGHVADMISRMKQNRDLLKKKHYFKQHVKAGDCEVSKKHKQNLSHKKASLGQLQKIREETREEKRGMRRKKALILFVSLLILLAIIYYIRNYLNIY